MISVLAFVVCLGLVSAAPREKRQLGNCVDPFQNVANPCIDDPTNQVFFPHPTDKSKFIQCDPFGRMYIVQCPMGELYNAATNSCTMKTVKPSVVVPVVNTVKVTAQPQQGNPCTKAAISRGALYYAVLTDNTKFIECDLLGHANILTCPSGLVWEQARLACVNDISAPGGGQTGTGSGTGSTGTGTGGTGTGTGGTGIGKVNPCSVENVAKGSLFFAHPDVNKFYQCDLWGDVFVNNCPINLVWNDYAKTCASAYKVINGVNLDNLGGK